MTSTLFTTPIVNRCLRPVSHWALRIAGWRVEGALPPHAAKCVMIAAPHTSNWDLPLTLMAAFELGLNIRWMGKASIFRPPFGALMRWLGGIAVRREQSNNLVAASVDALTSADGPMQLVIPPEGTRSRSRYWKTGFYHIAAGAKLPILMAYIDYAERRVGLGPIFQPTGDIEADLAAIKAFYAPFQGRRSQRIVTG